MTKSSLKKYCPSFERCRAALNPSVMVIEQRETFEIACLLNGFKSVQISSIDIFNRVDNELKKLFEAERIRMLPFVEYTLSELQQIDVKVAMVPTHKREERVAIFAPEGKRAAYLFVAWQLAVNQAEYDSPGSRYESHNPYLAGAILAYAQEDRLFFYQIAAFVHTAKKLGIKVPDTHFVVWPDDLKQEFARFVENDWQKAAIYQLWLRDTKEAEEWLAQWNGVPTEKLKRHCQEEQLRIEGLFSSLLAPKKKSEEQELNF